MTTPTPRATDGWRPTATVAALSIRAELMNRVRAYFSVHDVLEIDPPVLQPGANLDPGLEPLAVDTPEGRRWLPTSPEHPLKRLVAAGYGPVWALAPAFRAGERGARHLPEFRMLEWYRPGWPLERLIAETVTLLALLTGRSGGVVEVTWREAFQRYAGFDPVRISADQLTARSSALPAASRSEQLDWLWSQAVEPHLGRGVWTVIRAWPAERAAQARVQHDADGFAWAHRFEVVREGLELANGYDECPDAAVLAERFHAELAKRTTLGHDLRADDHLIAALASGFPPCCGVAVGFDRCVMLAIGSSEIAATMAFARG